MTTTDSESLLKRANLNRSVEISRRQFERGECFDHAAVMHDVHAELQCVKETHIPNAETIAAIKEGDRIASDPTRKTYDNLDEFWADISK